MLKLTIACTVALAGIVGCSSERANSSPPESPPGVDVQYNDPEASDSKTTESDTAKTGESDTAAAETKKTESSKQQDSKTNVSSHEATRETGKSATKCEGLTQKKCEISDGCAWHTDKKCVAQ